MNNAELVATMARRSKARTAQELLMLGILASGPKHGYEVRKEIDEKFSVLVALKPSSVYYTLDKLRERGLLEASAARSGKRPRKFVYRLTRRGRRRMREILLSNVIEPEKPYFDVDLSIYFAKHSDMDNLEEALNERLRSLRIVSKWDFKLYAKHHGLEIDKCVEMIREHNVRMVKQEISFTKRLIKCVKEEMAAK